MESFISYKPQAPGNRRACLLLRLSCSLSLISREPRHFHWVQVPTLLSLARALSPGGKAQIAHKVVPPEMAPSALSDLLSCPTQTCLVQSPERLSQMIERVQGTQTDLAQSWWWARNEPPAERQSRSVWQQDAAQLTGNTWRPQSTGTIPGQFHTATSASISLPSTSDSHPAALVTAGWLLRHRDWQVSIHSTIQDARDHKRCL